MKYQIIIGILIQIFKIFKIDNYKVVLCCLVLSSVVLSCKSIYTEKKEIEKNKEKLILKLSQEIIRLINKENFK